MDYYRFIHEMANVHISPYARHTLNPDLYNSDLVLSSKILGVKYALSRIQGGKYLALWKASNIMPHALLLRHAISIPNREQQLQYFKQPDFNPKNKFYFPALPYPIEDKIASKIDLNEYVQIQNYSPNRIDIDAISSSNAYLVLNELYYPGWKAYVDGIEAPILRADYLLRAVYLPSGRHKINFSYKPLTFIVGSIITFVTLLSLGCIAILRRGKKNGYKIEEP